MPNEPAPKPEPKKAPKAKPAGGKRRGPNIEKILCWVGLVLSAGLAAAFLADLFIQKPFGGMSAFLDVIAVLACGTTAYLSWDTLRELR